MRESTLWHYIRRGLSGKCLMTRIESSAGNGFPDVILHLPNKHSFMELKYVPKWPKRASTKVKLPLRSEQKLWIKTRGEFSHDVWAMIRIEDDFFLLSHEQALEACEGFTKLEWYNMFHHTKSWTKQINFDQLYKELFLG